MSGGRAVRPGKNAVVKKAGVESGSSMSRIRTLKPVPRGCAVFIGGAFVLAGMAALVWIGLQLAVPMLRVRAWEAVPCRVLRAEVERGMVNIGGRPQFTVRAELEWSHQGTRHTGGKLDSETGFHTHESVNDMEELCYRLRQQPEQTCYVNPDNPGEAILRQPAWWPVFVFTGLAALFVFLGIFVLRSSRRAQNAAAGADARRTGLAVPLVIGLGCLAGAAAIWWWAIRAAPDWKAVGARMREVPATVVGGMIKEDRGSGRSRTVTWRPVITFSYEWDGRTWHSEWYNFNRNTSSSSDRGAAVQVLERYPLNSKPAAWVDPEQPWVAVLEKSGAGFQWAWIPLAVLALLGALLVFAAMRMAGRRRSRPSSPPGWPDEGQGSAGMRS